MTIANQQSFAERLSEKRKHAGVTQKTLADTVGVSLISIQNYEAGRVPNGAVLIRLARALSCSADWLVTGEKGEEIRGGTAPEQPTPAAAAPRQDAVIYNDTGLKKSNISDLVAKTIEVLQSNTVFQFALESNIEAFHQAIILERKIDQVEGVLSKRLDALEADNARLKEELASCRVRDELSDTG